MLDRGTEHRRKLANISHIAMGCLEIRTKPKLSGVQTGPLKPV